MHRWPNAALVMSQALGRILRAVEGSPPTVLAGLLFALAVARAVPSVDWLDSGNLVVSAFWMGVAHPPGEPAWLVPARLAQLLPVGDLAFRCTLLSAVFVAACAWPLCWLVRALGGSRRSELLAGLLALLGTSVQLQAVRGEVYGLTLLFLLLALAAAIGRSGLRSSAALGFLLGLGAGVHPLLVAAAVPALGLARVLRGAFGVRDLLAGGLAGLAGFGVYAWLPLRALALPERAWGNPDSLSRFIDVLLARTFARNFGDAADATPLLDNAWVVAQVGGLALLPLLLPLAWIAWKRSTSPAARTLALVWPLWWLGNALTVLPQNKVFTSNPDLHGYLAVGAVALVPLAVVGIEQLRARRALVDGIAWAVCGLLLLSLLASDRSGNHLARRYATELSAHLPPGAVLMTSGNDPAFTWLYLQGVERRRADLVVVHRILLGHSHEERRLAATLRSVGLPWTPGLRAAPLDHLAALDRPFYLELREPEQAALADGRLLRHGLVAGWGGVPRAPPPEPERLVSLRRAALDELFGPAAWNDPQGQLVRGYFLELWGTP